MSNNQNAFFDLIVRFNNLRYLITIAEQQYGLNSPEVLRYSEELDKLTIHFQLQNS